MCLQVPAHELYCGKPFTIKTDNHIQYYAYVSTYQRIYKTNFAWIVFAELCTVCAKMLVTVPQHVLIELKVMHAQKSVSLEGC